MKRLMLMVVATCACTVAASEAHAQYVTYFRPVTTYYAPAPVVTTVASPVVSAPTVTYYAPAPTVVTPAPTVTYYAPAPAPVTTVAYYPAAPRVVYQPAATSVTRYRPILGGTVTRVRPAWAPVVVY